jgi:hypothetical protein
MLKQLIKVDNKRRNRTISPISAKSNVVINQSFEDNRSANSIQKKIKMNLMNSSTNKILQSKRDLRGIAFNGPLGQSWQPARDTALEYVDSAVSDWIDCAIKLNIPAMKRTEFGHGSKKRKDGSRKANAAYARLRDLCRNTAHVVDKYSLTQL